MLLQSLSPRLDSFGLSSFNGVLCALQYGLCLLMIRSDTRRGIVISIVLQSISALFIAIALLRSRSIAPLPGLFNTLFYIITLVWLAHLLRVRERETVTDVLTGLLNRRGLSQQLKLRIEDGNPFHVMYVDLGNFKFINDSHGHRFGDKLLKVVTSRISGIVGKQGIVTRIGGDEFVIILGGGDPMEMAHSVLDSIREKITVEVNDTKVDCYLTAYVGISSFPKDAQDYESLIKYADIAMFEASRVNTTGIEVFNKGMDAQLRREVEVEKLIKEGLEHDYFYLVYQPQYHLDGKKLRGFESLIRLKTPDGTFVSPGEFIPVAEKGELALRIDDYVLRRAMMEFKDIVERFGELTVSVNVSARNIAARDFPDKVKAILEETGYPAKNLEVEITEYCMVDSVDTTVENIRRLREMGVQTALDDFGTGYTSLNYLAKMPINLLKVDKSLVDDIESNTKSSDFVHAVISMGHLMGCEVIAEGVETENQLSVLGGQDCDFVQGFVWGKPLEYSAARTLAEERQ
ncbi:MAG: putative bifunctional diguanylate cyclase/phosphodiesterase [Oscillospiraceae bacterium]